MSGNVRIWWDVQVQAYRVVTPFNQGFVESLKRLIPISDRAWDKEQRIWTISERFFKPVEDLAKLVFKDVTSVTKEQAEKATQPKVVSQAKIDDVMIAFFKLVPQDCMAQAYKRAAMQLHPDRGGSMEHMSMLNSYWTRLENEFYKKG
jgi:hypothetical protein